MRAKYSLSFNIPYVSRVNHSIYAPPKANDASFNFLLNQIVGNNYAE